jgi:hypothetical protein
LITTHVLDTARGKPAAGVPVRLERGAETVADEAVERLSRLPHVDHHELVAIHAGDVLDEAFGRVLVATDPHQVVDLLVLLDGPAWDLHHHEYGHRESSSCRRGRCESPPVRRGKASGSVRV